jgi:hypothetical protein
MKINIDIKEIFILSILFTALAVYFDIHREHHVFAFIVNHAISLLIALIMSKLIYHFINNRK